MVSWLRVPIRGGSTLIDFDSWDLLMSRSWHVSDTGYVVSRGGEPKRTIRFHRLVAETPRDLVTDHINHNRLDNRRSNLRYGTHQDNMRNLSDPGKGYWYHKQNKNWTVEIYGVHRGSFETEAEASEFAALVRAGLADKKPRVEKTHCKHGHSLEKAYLYRGKLICRECRTNAYRLKPRPEKTLRAVKEHCLNGHARTPENLTDNGSCRKCARIRAKSWRSNNISKEK